MNLALCTFCLNKPSTSFYRLEHGPIIPCCSKDERIYFIEIPSENYIKISKEEAINIIKMQKALE